MSTPTPHKSPEELGIPETESGIPGGVSEGDHGLVVQEAEKQTERSEKSDSAEQDCPPLQADARTTKHKWYKKSTLAFIIVISSTFAVAALDERASAWLSIQSSKLDPNAIKRVNWLDYMAAEAHFHGQHQKAVILERAACEEAKKLPASARILCLYHLAQYLCDKHLGDVVGAEKAYYEAIETSINEYGERSPQTGQQYISLASFLALKYGQKDHPECLKFIRKAIWCYDHSYGPFNERSAQLRHEYFGAAETKLERQPNDNGAPDIGKELTLGHYRSGERKYGEAEEHFKNAILITKEHYGQNHPLTALTVNCYACFLRGRGRKSEAESLEKIADTIWANPDLPHWTYP